jgi:predicted ABC-type transport system involved in lysophospholipase L1 biosynthesis ATPase subunit
MDLLLEIADESAKSLVLVTHNPEFAVRTQRQLVLHFGKLDDA